MTNDSAASAGNFLKVVAIVVLVYMLAACSYGYADCGPASCKVTFQRFWTDVGFSYTSPTGGSFVYSSNPNEALTARLLAALEARQVRPTPVSPALESDDP